MKPKIAIEIQNLICAVHWDLDVVKQSSTGLREGRMTETQGRRGLIEGARSIEASAREIRRVARKLNAGKNGHRKK